MVLSTPRVNWFVFRLKGARSMEAWTRGIHVEDLHQIRSDAVKTGRMKGKSA
jgi:hypothetical protein